MISHEQSRRLSSAPRMFESSYDELRRIARRCRLAGDSADEAKISALVHETYIRFRRRLQRLEPDALPDRKVFLRVMTLMMKSVAIDRWRRMSALRRGAGRVQQLFGPEPTDPGTDKGLEPSTVLALDVALDQLREEHPDWFEVIVERYLIGRSHAETASRLGIGPAEVRRRRRRGLAWMRQSMGRSQR
jgi:RNA polymerase sigma factor (sigma-70 family)